MKGDTLPKTSQFFQKMWHEHFCHLKSYPTFNLFEKLPYGVGGGGGGCNSSFSAQKEITFGNNHRIIKGGLEAQTFHL